MIPSRCGGGEITTSSGLVLFVSTAGLRGGGRGIRTRRESPGRSSSEGLPRPEDPAESEGVGGTEVACDPVENLSKSMGRNNTSLLASSGGDPPSEGDGVVIR